MVVTVDDKHLDSLPDVVEQLRDRGLQVEQVLEMLGTVTGTAADADALRTVEGVQSVSQEESYQISPPEEEIQ